MEVRKSAAGVWPGLPSKPKSLLSQLLRALLADSPELFIPLWDPGRAPFLWQLAPDTQASHPPWGGASLEGPPQLWSTQPTAWRRACQH